MPVIDGDNGNNSLNDTAGDDTINGLDGDDTITVTGGNDSANGGDGEDTLIVSYGGATAPISGGFNTFAAPAPSFGVGFTGFERFVVTTGSGNDSIQIAFFDGNDDISTGGGDDYVEANSGDDTVDGGAGNDLIDVGTGNDSANGGTGNDRIAANMSAAVGAIVWNIQTNSYSGPIGSFTNFEYLAVSTGSGADTVVTGTGNFNDQVNLGSGDDSVSVYSGNDAVNGETGFDTLTVSYGATAVAIAGGLNAFAGTGIGVGFTDFERFVVTTGSGNDTIQIAFADGNDVISTGAGTDLIEANSGNDSLNGGSGADTLIGGAGNDFYFVDNVADVVSEVSGEGTDRIFASLSYTLAAGQHVETIGTTDIAGTGAINLTGNELANTMFGNAGNNTYNGGGGADTMYGYGGNDFYYVDNAADAVVEGNGAGTDRVFASASYTLGAGAHVETLSTTNNAGTDAINLTGNELANTLLGNAGNNTLNGGVGADSLYGYGGNDFFYVDNAADVVLEGGGGGTDRVFASVNYALAAGTQVETLSTTNNAGTGAINLTGNALANTILGNAGNNTLNGGGGADSLYGYGGNDFFYVDNAADTVIEGAGAGTDRVFANVSYALAAGMHVETMSTTDSAGGAAIDLTGNELANALLGNAGGNVLDGRGGADTLYGYGGADVFRFTTALGAGNVDAIQGYNVADDTIQLDDAVFAGLALGTLAAGAFNTGAAATQADDRIVYNTATGALLFDADGLGGVAGVQFATLSTGLALSGADFVVI